MGRKLFALSVAALLVAGSLAYAGELLQTVTFDRKDLVFGTAGGYDQVDLAGVPSYGPAGAPRLPMLVQALAIPAGSAVTGVDIVSTDESELPGVYNVVPSQRSVPLPMPGKTFKTDAAQPDAAVYQRNAQYPSVQATALSTGSLCGYRVGHVAISPVRYNPVTKKLSFAGRITYRVRYDENKAGNLVPTAGQKALFGQQARMLVANPGDVDRFAPRVQRAASKALPAGDYRSVIISGLPAYDTVFARLAAWHTRKGYRDTVVTIASIYSGYTGYDNAEKVRNFIIDAKGTWGTVFVLLAGQGDDLNAGQNLIPCRHVYYTASTVGAYPDEDQIPSDLYYSDLDGTWDLDGDHTYGETTDGTNLYSDVFVGRAPVLNVAQAQNFVAKTLNYEKDNPGGYIKKMLLPSAILWSSYEERPTQRAIAALTPAGWQDDSLFERNGTLSQSAMVASMNDGRGLGHWIGHGDENGIYMSSAYYSSTNAQAASNGDEQGVHISIACFTGAMDEVSGGDCMAEHIINRVGGGAVGVMMNSRYGWGAYVGSSYVMGPDEMTDTVFMHRIFRDNVHYQGQVLAMAKNAWVPYADSSNQYDMMRWCIYEKNCFGDPALPILTEDPIALNVAHNATLPVGSSSFTVTVTDPTKAAVEDALVCLMTESMDSYVYGTTDASGQVTLNPAPTAPGQEMYVTVTARNHQPYEGTATVIAPTGPYVTHLKHSMSDAGGNGDGIANPGETVQLPTWVVNLGVAQATGVVGTLRTASPNGTVTDSVCNYGDIAAGDSAVYSGGFGVLVNPADSNGTTIPLELECRDAADSVWTASFSLTVGTGVLAYNGKGIGGNGRLDPNETARLGVSLKNNGLGYSYGTSAVLRCGNPLVTCSDSTSGYGTINPGATGASGADSFTVDIGAVAIGTSVGFTVVMKGDGMADRSYSWSEVVGDLRYSPTPDNTAGSPVYYAVEDSDGVGRAPVYSWAEIRGVGTALTGLLDDDAAAAVTLPFTFRWYGANYTALRACSNGWIAFGTNTSTAYSNTVLPTTTFTNGAVFALWNDLDGRAANAPGAWVGYYNDAANGRFIVEWDSIIHYGTTKRLKFQVMYYDSTASHPYYDVVVQYNLYQDDQGTSGYYSSVGFQQNGTTGAQLLFNQGYASTMLPLGDHRAVRLTRSAEPLGVAGGPGSPAGLPQAYHLGLAYPNPFKQSTMINYQIPKSEMVDLAVYNIAGQKVRTLVSGARPAGYHTARWDGRDQSGAKVSAGIYLFRLTTPAYTRTGKLSLVK